MITAPNHLSEMTKLAQEGRTSNCIQQIQQEINQNGPTFSLLSNLAVLHFQLGNLQYALTLSSQAIQNDPYSYIGYFNRFLCYLNLASLVPARKQLHKALSCLYMLRAVEEKSIKHLNKSIQYCSQNSKAYLLRAKMYENKNNKFAENDYFAAIEYDPKFPQIYQQRALFFRKINRRSDFEDDLITYNKLKKESVRIVSMMDNQGLDNEQEIQRNIESQSRQFYDILFKVQSVPSNNLTYSTNHQQTISKLPLSSVQSNIANKKDDQQLLLSDRPQEGSTQTITIRKQQIQFRKKHPEKTEQNFRQIFEDESSRELDDKIDKLERQIQTEGGVVDLQKDEEEDDLDVSDPTNFLTQEIQKAIKQINKLSSPDVSEVKSAKSQGSHISRGSVKSQPKELTQAQFNEYKTINIEIVSLEDIQSYKRKQTAKVQLKYGGKVHETSMKKFEWRQEFSFAVVGDQSSIEVVVIQKGGIFRSDSQLGQGSVNLLQPHTVKCILGNRQKKVAILYFKLSLK